MIGLLTGHARLNERLHRMSLASDPLCAACGIEEESAYLSNCQTLSNIRTRVSEGSGFQGLPSPSLKYKLIAEPEPSPKPELVITAKSL
jgi:hypothetical protein